jgi:hypothetical protein
MAELLASNPGARSIFHHVDGRDPTYHSWKVRTSQSPQARTGVKA